MEDQKPKFTKETLLAQLAMLWTTSQFFTSLQNIMLEKESTSDLGLSEIQKQLEELPSDISIQEPILEKIQKDLEDAYAQILLADARISVSVMRRFFEKTGESESISLKHIIQYYFGKPVKDESDRDKADLLLTRFCSIAVTSANNLKQRQVKDNLEALLVELCPIELIKQPLEFVQTAVVSRLRQLCRVIIEARSFNTLIEGKLISQLRDYKISLGDMFFAPAVLTEIIRMNIAIHNKFQELYFSEQARLRTETARMLNSLQTGRHLIAKDTQNPLIGQLNNLILQMQQYIQDLRRNLTDQIIQDRSARVSIEADGNSLTSVISSLEESLLRSRNLLSKLQDVYLRLEHRDDVPVEVRVPELKPELSSSGIRKIDFTSPESLDKLKSSLDLATKNIDLEAKPNNIGTLHFNPVDKINSKISNNTPENIKPINGNNISENSLAKTDLNIKDPQATNS